MSLLRRIEKGSGSGSGGSGGNPPGGTGDLQSSSSDIGGAESEESKLAAMRQRRQAIAAPQGARGKENSYLDLKSRVQNKLLSELDHQNMDVTHKNEVRTHIEELFNAILADE